ncbi:hypothetical protein K439DRAFT_1622389 [Ramaria rubella]|nr:hypothetical protein K439DRAFT_1622389 [Ramaria rubella]
MPTYGSNYDVTKEAHEGEFPCHNCIKRGLSAICPEGSLPTRPKVLVEEASRLNKKNAELSERIRLLEEGLASIQAGISDDVHPLLAKTNTEEPPGSTEAAGSERETDEINDSLGTLTIDEDGRSLFLGNTAGVENELPEQYSPGRKQHITIFPSASHPLGIFSTLTESKEEVMDRIQQYLPPKRLALALTEFYFDHGAWLYNPISKSRFLDQVYNPVYGSDFEEGLISTITPHNTAVLFMIFALGSYLSRDNGNDAATEHYHQIARTAMSCDAILMLMAYYHLLCDKNGSQNCWAMLGLASHMAQNIGLHRDSWRWKLDEAIVEERRDLFWELYWLGVNQCLSFGRPPSLMLAYCDCEIPLHEDRLEKNRAGEIKPGFHIRKFKFASECLSQVVEAVLGIKHTPYSTILALDRKVRDNQSLKVPPNGATGPAELGAATATLTLQRFMLKAAVEMTLLYLHRRYFARAVSDYPTDILGCRFGPSVLATYRSASMYITLMRSLCALQPELPSKFVVFWNHLLASSIVVGSVATKCPQSVLAPSAISELESCYVLFENAAKFGNCSGRPARAVTIVSKLRDRAYQVATAIKAGLLPDESTSGMKDDDPERDTDELLILSGRGRLVSAKSAPSAPRTSSVTSNTNMSGRSQQSGMDTSNVHPLLLNNLRLATQQEAFTSQSVEALWNDATMWENASIGPQLPGTFRPDNFDYAFGSAVGLGTTCGDVPPVGGLHQPPKTEHEAVDVQSWYQTPPAEGSVEEECHGGLGTAMSWESNWQGYMQQLGVPGENDLGF